MLTYILSVFQNVISNLNGVNSLLVLFCSFFLVMFCFLVQMHHGHSDKSSGGSACLSFYILLQCHTHLLPFS